MTDKICGGKAGAIPHMISAHAIIKRFQVATKENEGTVVYRTSVLVRFGDCDPAGMAFYPRYMEMFNNLVEDWCHQGLDLSFAELHARCGWGLPTVHLDADFVAPSFLGEMLHATILLRSLGTRSISLGIQLCGPDGTERVRGGVVLVLMDLRTKRSLALPADIRDRILASCESDPP